MGQPSILYQACAESYVSQALTAPLDASLPEQMTAHSSLFGLPQMANAARAYAGESMRGTVLIDLRVHATDHALLMSPRPAYFFTCP